MIVAEISDKRVHISGHAAHGRVGEDIVCAAVSSLWYAITEKMKKENIVHQIYEDIGDCELIILHPCIVASFLIDTMLCGLELIAQNYPENLLIKKC